MIHRNDQIGKNGSEAMSAANGGKIQTADGAKIMRSCQRCEGRQDTVNRALRELGPPHPARSSFGRLPFPWVKDWRTAPYPREGVLARYGLGRHGWAVNQAPLPASEPPFQPA